MFSRLKKDILDLLSEKMNLSTEDKVQICGAFAIVSRPFFLAGVFVLLFHFMSYLSLATVVGTCFVVCGLVLNGLSYVIAEHCSKQPDFEEYRKQNKETK